jgi:hypothetical protein
MKERRVVTAALYSHPAGTELRVYFEPESAGDLLHSQVERFDVRVLEDKATALRDVLLAKGWRDLQTPILKPKDVTALRRPDCPKCVDGWICEAHPNHPWPHDQCAGPGMPCDAPGCVEDALSGQSR